MITQSISVVGAVLILAAFTLLQLRKVPSESYAYQTMNFGGGVALFYVAIVEYQVGFILLEGAWSVLSLIGMWRLFRAGKSVGVE